MQTLILYGITNCNTVKKARDWLLANQITVDFVDFVDFKKHDVSAALLDNWLSQVSHEKLINRAGLTWRGLDNVSKTSIVDNASAKALMQAKTSVIKRPILEKNGKILFLGFNETAYKEIFK